tara:strand:- start:882 stop:1979 length:1098 start_codon:yes stop_codon:yes gene_type:complete
MKINLIIFISDFNLGGAGNSLFRLCKYLPKKIFEISVICINNCSYKKELKKNNIKVFEIKASRTLFAMNEVRNIVKEISKKKFKKSIFLSNIYYSNILSILFLRDLSLKIILVERTPFKELNIYYGIINFLKKNLIKILIYFTYKKANLCISNSKFISRAYNRKYNLNFKTIYPPSFIPNLTYKKKFLNNKKKINLVTVCRLAKEKGISDFLKIIPVLKKQITFHVFGDGPEKNKLKEQSKRLEIEKNVIFHGSIKPNQIIKKITNYDLFINCSDFEGFPNSVVEALGSGIPVIASQSHGGINEIVKNSNFGYIYNNKKELIKIINDFNSGKIKFNLKKKIIVNHLKNFSISENIKKYSDIFKKI